MKLRLFILFLFSFLLTGCWHAWILPWESVSLEDFVVTEEELQDQQVLDWQKEGKTFSEVYFPESCQWVGFRRVVDGDTIVVNTNTRVRMVGIDTPESVIPNTPPEPLGVEASNYLAELLQDVDRMCLLTDPIGDAVDKYKRQLAYVYLEDGSDINGEMVQSGFARGYYKYPFARKDEFKVFEKEAQNSGFGVWGLPE